MAPSCELGRRLQGPPTHSRARALLGQEPVTKPLAEPPRASEAEGGHRHAEHALTAPSPRRTALRASSTGSPGPAPEDGQGSHHPPPGTGGPRGAPGSRVTSALPHPILCAPAPPPPAHQAQLAALVMGGQRRVLQVDDAALVRAQPGGGDSQGVVRQELWARRKRERHAGWPARAGQDSSGGPALTALAPGEIHIVQG